MNILMTIHHHLDANAGAPGVTLKLAKALRARGHRVDILSHDDLPGLRGIVRDLAFPFYVAWQVARRRDVDVLDMSAGDGWVVNLLRHVFGWRSRQLSATRSHGMEPLGHMMLLEACRRGAMTRSWKYPLYRGSVLLWQCTKSFAWSDLALVLNEREFSYARDQLGMPESRIALVENGIDDYFATAARTALAQKPAQETASEHIEPRVRQLAFVGRASYWKGIDTLAQGVSRVLAAHPDLTIRIVGTGEAETTTLERFAPEVRAQVLVQAKYDNTRLPELLSDCQLFVYPARFDGFPLAPLEAMACGLVPVTSDMSPVRPYVHHGKNGLMVPMDDAPALAAAIESLIVDPQRWRALRTRALETASGYSWDELARRFELLYARRWKHNSAVAAA